MMKATGIVRRIDDLGRVVIPKEIRRVMRIREGDPLEIFTEKNGEVIFKKYSSVGELTESAGIFADTLCRVLGNTVAVTDKDSVITVSGPRRRELEEHHLSQEAEEQMQQRRPYVYRVGGGRLRAVNGAETCFAGILVPLICSGDLIGSFLVLLPESGAVPSEADVKVVSSSAQLFVRQLEM